MNKLQIVAFALAALALAGSATEASAWFKDFRGTRAQVVNACSGPDMVLVNGSTDTLCKNLKNDNYVNCNDAGQCNGGGTGPDPTRTAETLQLRGTLFGTATASADQPAALTGSIVEVILKWYSKGKKKVAEEPMESSSTPRDGGPPPSDAPAPQNEDQGEDQMPQWHSNGGVIL